MGHVCCCVCIFRGFSVALTALYVSPHHVHFASVLEFICFLGVVLLCVVLMGLVLAFSVWHVGSAHFHPSAVCSVRFMFSRNVSVSCLRCFRLFVLLFFSSVFVGCVVV